MMLAVARSIPQANYKLRNGEWDRKTFMGVELRNKTLGVIGLGKIGSQVAKRAKAFDMKVVAYDPYISRSKAKLLEVEMMDLVDLLVVSDFITIHLPKTEETKILLIKKPLN